MKTVLPTPQHQQFPKDLLQWAKSFHRPLPWKGIDNPYFIWLSEIILQQTRVEQGTRYFHAFKDQYPTVHDLANASEDQVLKLWEGLGYYSRARNLHSTAKFISNNLDGVFPSDYDSILSLKGIGPYTAAAIASFAFGLPHAVVDGNVFRVLSRVFGIETPIDTTDGKKEFTHLAQLLLNKKKPGVYNQAIMDFGATVCTPKKADCNQCPFNSYCVAYKEQKIAVLPVKSKKLKKRTRHFNFLVFDTGSETLVQKRTEKDIWQGLYQFPLIDKQQNVEWSELTDHPIWQSLGLDVKQLKAKRSKPFQQLLTHQKIISTFWEIPCSGFSLSKNSPFLVVNRKNLNKFAFPKSIDLYLNDNSLYLELF